ncbi:MAG: hypothetical protein HYV76_00470 [Candidatus Vogelbacteria bacterium]|nr:hypothetical protein [Candidatus Vogelbacteria bacterium]
MKKYIAIGLVLLAIIVVPVGVVQAQTLATSYNQQLINLLREQIQVLTQILQKLLARQTTANWQTYSFNNYQFLYPSGWVANPLSNGATFAVDGEHVGSLRCPIREVGYEAWDIESQTREIKQAGKTYKVELWNLKDRDRKAASDFSLIFINRDDFQQSCELGVATGKNYDPKIAQQIYSSVAIQNTPVSTSLVPIIKNNWGVSFTKSPNWNLISDTGDRIELKQVSGDSVGDTIDISYISGTSITTSDTKFGTVTYYYDESNQRWMTNVRQSEKTGETLSPIATPYIYYPYTADGLPVLVGAGRWATFIIPLSHSTFLKLHIDGSGKTKPLDDLLRTIKKI